jgi:hypothetical protein
MQQSEARPGETVVPLMFFTDDTHLTNFSGDKKASPLYMTTGNIPISERTKRKTHSVVLVGWLPTPPKASDGYTENQRKAKTKRDWDIFQSALRIILDPLLEPDGCRYDALCSDRKWRKCWSPLAAWIADYPEYIKLLGLKYGDCISCETPQDELQDHPPDQLMRDHGKYQMLCAQGTTRNVDELEARGVKWVPNVLYDTGCDLSKLPKPDILHGLQLGLPEYVITWTLAWLREVGLSETFKQLWLSSPAYHNMRMPTKTLMDISQYSGEEFRVMARILLALLEATVDSVKSRSDQFRTDYTHVYGCVQGLLDLVSRQNSKVSNRRRCFGSKLSRQRP